MANLTQFNAKVCYTAAGVLILENQVLLVHHKKADIWLPPGGHIDEGELPHQAAEREFKEEAGIAVTTINTGANITSDISQYLPTPFAVNLHWINQDSYHKRIESKQPEKRHTTDTFPKGCEQHITFIYRVKPVSESLKIKQLDLKHDQAELKDIGWFTLKEVDALKTTNDIKNELHHAFSLE